MYFYINHSDVDFIIVDDTLYYINESIDYYKETSKEIKVFDYKDFNEKFIINTRTDDEEYSIYIGYNNFHYDSFYAYTIDNEKFEKAAEIFNKNKVIIEDFEENYINGYINLEKDLTIYTSIPYDKGWQVYVNGKKTETFKIGNSLLGFDVLSGESIIELKYQSKGIVLGSIISITSVIICIALSSKRKKL